jgi:hypothetical protein
MLDEYYFLVESEGQTVQLKIPTTLVLQLKAENLLPPRAENLLPLPNKQPLYFQVIAS